MERKADHKDLQISSTWKVVWEFNHHHNFLFRMCPTIPIDKMVKKQKKMLSFGALFHPNTKKKENSAK